MRKIAKYIVPFIPFVIIAVAFLFVQANAELSLPDYMSRIVNIGIQQSGVEHAAPEGISKEGMGLATLLASQSDAALIASSYDETASDSRFPGAQEAFYIRKDMSAEDLAKLDSAFSRSARALLEIAMNAGMAQGSTDNADSSDASSTQSLADMDIKAIYSMLPLFSQMPEQALSDAISAASNSDDMLLSQTGIAMAGAYMAELGYDIETAQRKYIVNIGLTMLLIAFISGCATIIVSYCASRTAAGVARNLRKDLFAKVESFSVAEFDKFSTASLITRTTNDIVQVQMLIGMGLRMICYAPIMGIGGVLMAVEKSPSMSWLIALSCIVLIGLMAIIMPIVTPRFKLMQKLIDRLNLVSREHLSGLMVIRAFGTQEHEKKRFDGANSDLTANTKFVNRVMALMNPAMSLIMNGTTLLILWIGAKQIAASQLMIGDMMAFMQYAMQIIMSFLMISMMFVFVPRAAVSAERIAEVLETEPSIKNPANPKPLNPAKKGEVEFRNVSFGYPTAQEDALSGISFTAPAGKTTAIIGPTGSGKSTVLSLMLRFYDATGGQVLIEGTDVREASLEDIRARIGYVPQKGMLLSGTIESNLKYGDPESDFSDIETAAQVAQAMDFISEKPDGFGSEIAQHGANVSGGQKQRLSIARALVKKPSIFLFDDSFSALDFRTDARLRAALHKHTGDSTVIIVAQRVATILSADQIIVMDGGRIVGKGTHRELLKSCPEYYEIASSQLAKEELA